MTIRYSPVWPIVLVMALISQLSACGFSNSTDEQLAEKRLDELLPPTQPEPQQELNTDPFFGLPDIAEQAPEFLKKSMGQPNIDVQETTTAYQIRVEMANQKDMESVQVNVLPRRIEITGQTSFGGESGFKGTSSFMKSFATRTEVLPNALKRTQNDKHLVFTIPKKVASAPPEKPNAKQDTPSIPSPGPSPKLSPDALRELYKSNPRAI